MTISVPRALASLAVGGLIAACASGHSARTRPSTAQTVTAEDIEHNAGVPIEQVLQAKVPGLIVSRTSDGGIAIQMRGAPSFYGSSEPLYVVDDVPIKAGPGGALNGINPYNIESIKVLKDPADTGIYVIRGGNGVIVIKMKKPGRR